MQINLKLQRIANRRGVDFSEKALPILWGRGSVRYSRVLIKFNCRLTLEWFWVGALRLSIGKD